MKFYKFADFFLIAGILGEFRKPEDDKTDENLGKPVEIVATQESDDI